MASKRREEGAVQSGSPSDPRDESFHSPPSLSALSSPPEPSHYDTPPSIQASLGSKKVSFSEHIRHGDMARDSRLPRGEQDERESSADEYTVILGAERGRTRDYAATSSKTTETEAPQDTGKVKSRRRASARPDAPEEKQESWWKKTLEKYGSVELENKGSVARDHLALERTFLAWLRTSLSFASIGIAITQLFRLNTSIIGGRNPTQPLHHVGKPLGSTFIAISIVILFIGFHRYFESQHYVIRGKFPASRGSIVMVAMIAGALIVASLVVVLAIGRGEFEN